MKTILVPTDFSEVAQNATDVAMQLAAKMDSKIIMLHVVEDASVASVQYTGELAMPNAEDRLYIHKLIERAKHEFVTIAKQYPEIEIDEEMRVGNPYYSVQDMINEYEIDLVVMGTSGASGAKEFFVGSNAEKVVRRAKCPVLTVHQKADNINIKNIAFATDLAAIKGKHVDVIKGIEEYFEVKTHIVRVNTPNNFQPDGISIRELREYARKSGIKNYEVRVYNDITEEEGILRFSNEIDADLIVMATHGRKGLAHLIAGSIAEEVVNHTHRPVLTFVTGK